MNNNRLSEKEIRAYLDCSLDIKLMLFDSVGSTNIVMKQHTDSSEGLVIAASQQTDGRGRLGRSFFSPAGSGLYVSILLKPKSDCSDTTMLTAMSAVAVCSTIEQLTREKPGIKWVNDIFINKKKVCGILAQGAITSTGEQAYVIVGIGLNLYEPPQGFPQDIKEIAAAIYKENTAENNRFLAVLLNKFFALYSNYDKKIIASEYRNRSIVVGRDVTVVRGNDKFNAHVIEVDDSCNLIIRSQDGHTEQLQSGELSIRL